MDHQPYGKSTLFVANIAPGTPDVFVERILLTCGRLRRWRRVLDSEGRPRRSGFATFAGEKDALRCYKALQRGPLALPDFEDTTETKRVPLAVAADRQLAEVEMDVADEAEDVAKKLAALMDDESGRLRERGAEPNPDTQRDDDGVDADGEPRGIPSQYTPEQRALAEREIARFRGQAADDQRADAERRRLDEERRERRVAHDAAAVLGSPAVLERKAGDSERDASLVRDYEAREERRLERVAREKRREAESADRRAAAVAFWREYLAEFDDAAEEARVRSGGNVPREVKDYFRDPSRWWRHRQAVREREVAEDASEQQRTAVPVPVPSNDAPPKPPTEKELLETTVEWDSVTESLLADKIAPMVVQQTREYLGEADQDLVEFILEKLRQKTPAADLLQELEAVFEEDEARAFLARLWRELVGGHSG